MTVTSSSAERVGPPPPFDPELEAALTLVHGTRPASLTPDLIEAWRQGSAVNEPTDEELSRGGAFEAYERTVPGPAGAPDVTLLICRPVNAPAPTPVLYNIHGGGMVLGNRRMGLVDVLDMALEAGAAVVSVEYRLAPEHPHPAPVEDCYAGLLWVADNTAELNADPGRIVVVGTSAGGGLAAAVVLMARDRKGPALAGQMLLCPMLDDRNDTPSAVQMEGVGFWDRTSNETGWTALLGDARGGPDVSPYAAPARATDLSGLPPAFIDVGSAETFRDEDVAYATAIWRAGGQAELHVWPGGFHGFAQLAPHAAVSQAAKAARPAWLRRIL
jgi:acetyl esterase/lipase